MALDIETHMSPTQRSLAKLRADGWLVAIVEKWNVHAKVRQDLFGFADLLAIKDGLTLAVQTTSSSNVSERLHKITANAAATLWLRSQEREIVIHGWSKRGPRGQRKTWQCRIVKVERTDSSGVDAQVSALRLAEGSSKSLVRNLQSDT